MVTHHAVISTKIMKSVLSLTIMHLQMSAISNNPIQTQSHTDSFGLDLFVMLESFIRRNEQLKKIHLKF